MSADAPTVMEATIEFFSSLPAELRANQQQEINRFVRWFGQDRRVAEIVSQTLETYQQQVESSGADVARRMEPLKSFLIYAQRKSYLPHSIAKLIKFKKVTSKRLASAGSTNGLRDEEVVQLTKGGYDQLKTELDYLVNEVRPLVAHELREARIDKDFRENAPYDAAKQHQAHVESRIRDVEKTLGAAQVMTEGPKTERIGIGSTVVIHDLSYDEQVKYTLVSSSEADPRAGKISVASPVGKALLERIAGDVVEVTAPAGTMHYRVESIEG